MKRDFLLGGTKLPTGGAVRGAGGAMSPPVFMLKEALTVNEVNSDCRKRNFYTHIKINDITIRVNIDSGASVNIIDNTSSEKLTRQNNIHALDEKQNKTFCFCH